MKDLNFFVGLKDDNGQDLKVDDIDSLPIKFKLRNNTAKYKKLADISVKDRQHLEKMDSEIDRIFQRQMQMKNKNEEMITNKINDLNDKPGLRDYLFKKVSDDQLTKDIEEVRGQFLAHTQIQMF